MRAMEPTPSSAAEFESYIRTETVKWARVIRKAQIMLD